MMMEGRIKAVMAAVFDMKTEDIDDNASPDTIGSWDSLHHMNLIVALEEEFGMTFNEEDMANMLNYQLIKLTLSEHDDKK
jgi:acyl carrier protein